MERKVTVIRAEVSGFCSGVKRALTLAEECAHQAKDKPVCTLGDLVHNSQVMDRLAEQGIEPVSSVEEVKRGTVIIRAHGTTEEVLADLERRGLHVVDATCPKVKRSHGLIEKYSDLGYQILIAGERNHSEVHGLVSRAKACDVVQTEAEAERVECTPPLMLLAQTTFSPIEYKKIISVLTRRYGEVEVSQTICPAMERRHEAVQRLAEHVDAVLVVGGKNSANTRRLYEKAKAVGKPSWHIEQASDLPIDVYTYGRVGIAAGASTPEWIVREIEQKLEQSNNYE